MGQDPEAIRADIEQTRAEMSDTVDALGYKADVKSRAKDKINRITGKVSDATPDTGQVKRAASTAQENPLGLAIGGVAVGFLAGLLVPSSRVEDEKLGPIADQVKDQVKETGQEALERGKDVAQQAAETAKEAGREHAQQLGDSTQSRAGAAAPS
jgi:ElaB/YqjD/DUF883 family membrane-anchored ribosome-binding protein